MGQGRRLGGLRCGDDVNGGTDRVHLVLMRGNGIFAVPSAFDSSVNKVYRGKGWEGQGPHRLSTFSKGNRSTYLSAHDPVSETDRHCI